MKEIKFRVWNKKEKKMTNLYRDYYEEIAIDILRQYDLNLIPMQYIGLLDTQGKEIYEFDIVRGYSGCGFVDDVIGVVKYEGMAFSIQGKQIKKKKEWFYTITSPKTQDNNIEITGNIYENEELLKEIKC